MQKIIIIYSKTCVKRPLKNRQNKDLNDKWKQRDFPSPIFPTSK